MSSPSILARGSPQQPLVVDTVPWGPDSTAGVVLSIISIIATIAISGIIWWYGDRTEEWNRNQERELRLQGHIALLSSTDAMYRIGDFQQQCEDMFLGSSSPASPDQFQQPGQQPSYGAVFRHGRQLSRNGVCITKECLLGVDAARKQLQGIWDNTCSDFKSDRLPGTIVDKRNSRTLKRGLTYLGAAEPLEAANYGRMQDRGHASSRKPYLIPAEGTPQPCPQFTLDVRPWRFRWLEDQQAVSLTGQKLWKDTFMEVPVSGGGQTKLKVAELDNTTWKELEKKGLQQEFTRRWAAVEAAYKKLAVEVPSSSLNSVPMPGEQGRGASHATAADSSELTQLVARQNVLLEQLLVLLEQQWPSAAASAALLRQQAKPAPAQQA